MAKTRSKQQGKLKSIEKVTVKKKKRGPSSSDAKKTKLMDEVLGVEPFELSDEEEDRQIAHQGATLNEFFPEPLTPKSSLNAILRQEEVQRDFNFFLAANHECSKDVATGSHATPPFLRSGSVVRNLSNSFENSKKPGQVKVTIDDIAEEISYWNSSLVCYIMGANPPLNVLDGFVRRLWKDKIDKVGLLSYGIFLIRFHEAVDRDAILQGGYIFFNKQPVIMKAWDPNVDFKKEDEFPSTIYFENEHGVNVPIAVSFEWKPVLCKNCKGMGHETSNCRKKEKFQQQWVIKNDARKPVESTVSEQGKKDEFQTVTKVFGDFNDILFKEERIGDKAKIGNSTAFIDCRAEAVFLAEGAFDHTPAVLNTYTDFPSGKKPFKYFRMWTSYPSYNVEVKKIRDQKITGTNMYQKSRLHWLKDGDENSALFHSSIRERRQHNNILSIEDVNGFRHEEPENITKAFLDFYQELLGSKMVNRVTVNISLVKKGACVTEYHSQILTVAYTLEELKEAVFGILAVKAPGLDGYNSSFYQDNWDLVKQDVFEAVTSFLHSGQLLKELNSTIINLVPKSKCPNVVSDYRPIACCNVLYQVATKMICSRLKLILPDLVAQNQGGFVKGRFIAHNIMVCQDLIRHCGRKNARPNCMIKLDLQKAYDTMEWSFLEEMLQAFQFPDSFIKLVMTCITTPRFSLLFNGSLHGFFEAKRGLRQGDPMSPLLFVLGMEYLSRIMKKIGDTEGFQFHERCGALRLNHLSFADDVLLFCRGDFKSVYLLLRGLKLFSMTSGLQPNKKKTTIYCSGMHESETKRLVDASRFPKSTLPFKYLGVPICAKKLSSAECSILVEKMTARIKVWSSKNLSFVGRTVLINSVLLSIHMYWSQVLILPKKVIKEIESICRSFLWSGRSTMNGPGNIAWEQLCKSKKAGGIGFQDIAKWNQAAIAKHVWAIATKKDNLWVKWVHNVYIEDEDWWGYEAPIHSIGIGRLVSIKDLICTILPSRTENLAGMEISEHNSAEYLEGK
uniref:Reverse transcriptase domain-containing protein n=1 Tax=Cannabis sativa TaxID=3483 RepID=A0A803PHP5_CANSA